MKIPEEQTDFATGPQSPGSVTSTSAPTSRRRLSPFTDARREWNSVLGAAAASINAWRLIAIVSSLVALVCAVGLLTLGADRKIVPFVAVVDRWGTPVAAGNSVITAANDPRVALGQLSQFVMNARMVTSDGYAQKQVIKSVYSMLSATDPAYQFLTDFYTAVQTDPFIRAKSISVSASITVALPVSPDSYRIEWLETTRDRVGKVLDIAQYQASVVTRREKGVDLASADTKNPVTNLLGIYVYELHWSRKYE